MFRLSVGAAVVRQGKILLVEFSDESGVHFNLPGGGVDEGESVQSALRRECLEEVAARVDVGRLLLVWENVPEQHAFKYGREHKVGLVFEARLLSEPSSAKWVPLEDLARLPLLPAIGEELVAAMRSELPVQFLENI